ncbi:hypothetical protein E2C01_035642 [Portunus trituberculatus]|uniref:Uncharacterized protein n=1 Tax=Portunus trituberculatus TaxID=210409 RepID=A0A5B7F3P5_PORTR|nr:hypothetical protein [Portunus trituberculatus]
MRMPLVRCYREKASKGGKERRGWSSDARLREWRRGCRDSESVSSFGGRGLWEDEAVRGVKAVFLSDGAGVGTLKLRNEPLKGVVESVGDASVVDEARGGRSVEKKRKKGAMEVDVGVGVGMEVICGPLGLS